MMHGQTQIKFTYLNVVYTSYLYVRANCKETFLSGKELKLSGIPKFLILV